MNFYLLLHTTPKYPFEAATLRLPLMDPGEACGAVH